MGFTIVFLIFFGGVGYVCKPKGTIFYVQKGTFAAKEKEKLTIL